MPGGVGGAGSRDSPLSRSLALTAIAAEIAVASEAAGGNGHKLDRDRRTHRRLTSDRPTLPVAYQPKAPIR